MKCRIRLLAVAAFLAAAGMPAFAQDQAAGASDSSSSAATQPGAQGGQPAEAYMVPAGTRFLVGLGETLSTKEDKAGKRFVARTLEPLAAADGSTLAVGTEVRGHIDKVEAAGKTGRAKLWLTFDDIHMPAGWKPLVAELIDAPGVHSIRVMYDHEGEIVVPSSKRQQEEEAVALAALAGAAPGVVSRNSKEAAIGAGIGAVTAFMATSGLGQELTIEKDTKLELVLGRPLAIRRS
ncbi:MAG: hypothetical protein WB780_04715 [Candidatus Acidiferrales bacterium]